MLITKEISYDDLIESIPSLRRYSICYLTNWSSLDPNFKYFIVQDKTTNSSVAAFSLYYSKRKGMQHISNPPFFQNCGLWISKSGKNEYYKNSNIKKALREIAEFLSSYKWINISFPPEIEDVQPFIWEGLSAKVRYTYLLSSDELPELINGSKGLRSQIKKINSEDVNYSSSLNSEGLGLIENSSLLGRKDHEKSYFKNLYKSLQELESFISITATKDGSAGVAAGILVGKSLVYLFGGSDKTEGISLGTAALVELLAHAKNSGASDIDFEGSMIPGVERYFRSFGAQLTPFYNVSKEPGLIGVKQALNL